MGRTLQVIELAGADCPQKDPYNQADQYQRQRDEQVNNFHGAGYLLRVSRSALITTSSELVDMPMAAIQGAT